MKQYNTQMNLPGSPLSSSPLYLAIIVRAFHTLSQEPFMHHMSRSQQKDDDSHASGNALSNDLSFDGAKPPERSDNGWDP
jgi:hypothetical protein